ncbi:unnamed protein product [Symbiodinium sp. CCMP2592]|nr:unnamed protein product [Symbiodinium sp. CCMP2592]
MLPVSIVVPITRLAFEPDSPRPLPPRWIRPPDFASAPVVLASHDWDWFLVTLIECFALAPHEGQPLEPCLQEFLFSWTVCPRILACLHVHEWLPLVLANDECTRRELNPTCLLLCQWAIVAASSLAFPREELEETGTGRPLPSHLDAFMPSEIDSEQGAACMRDREAAREVASCVDSSLLNDALEDSVLALGRSVVDIPLPWEQESMSLVFGEDDSVTKLLAGLPKHIPVPAVSSTNIQPSDLVAEPPAKRARQMPESGECFRVAISSRAYDSYEEKEEAQWRRALEKWLVILTECPGSSYIGETVAIQKTDDAIETLRELFGRKSGSTVMKRGSALMGYLSWGRKECRADDLFPFKSAHLDGYLKHLKSEKRPAGAFTSFQECVNFAIHVVGIAVDETVLGPKQSTVWSHWSKGVIGQAQLTKAERKQATVLLVAYVAALERMLEDESVNSFDRYACGAILFGIFSRSRVSDLRKTFGWFLDFSELGSGGEGFIECKTRDHKTANAVAHTGFSMPLVAPARGVTSSAWAVTWAKVAEDVGLGFSSTRVGPVLPAPDQKGGWTRRCVDSGEVTKWMRALLDKAGCDVPESSTSHAIKGTSLSWCSKYGMDKHTRLRLGHHSSGDGSLDAYGRDNLAPALLKYTEMLGSIRRGVFMPDLSRSGRFADRPIVKVEVSEDVDAVATPLADPATCGEQGRESESSDSSSESEPESGDEWVKGEDFRIMGSLTESTAAFASRAKEIGLTQADVATITGTGVDTLSKLAFATVPPGQSPSDDQVQRLFGATPITAGTMAAAKHLIFEAHTLVVQELKTRVQRGDSGAPSTLATAEREERITEQRARITGLLHRGVEEPSHASYDLVYSMLSADSLTYLGPDRFPTRQSELQGKKPGKELTIDGNSVTVRDKVPHQTCTTGTELELAQALRRRALAFDLVKCASYDTMNRYHSSLIHRLQELPPPTYVKISVAQVLRADRAAFTRIAENLPSIKRQPDGTLPLDRALENILQDPSISFHLLPLKGGEIDDNKRKWTDDAKKTDEPTNETNEGKRLCWAYNIDGCPNAADGEECPRGWHLCCEPNCFKAHPLPKHRKVKGVSLDECLVLEVSPGSGRLIACLKQRQLDNSFSVDRTAGRCCAPRIVIDLCTESGRKQFQEILTEENLIYVHFYPPCNTTSRARLRQFAGAPAILRNESHPDGVPGLGLADRTRVSDANAYLRAVAAACKTCHERGVLFSICNPESSFVWATKPLRLLLQEVPLFTTHFHLCSYDSPFKKAMRMLHSLPKFLELHRPCAGGHVHKFWSKGVGCKFDRDLDFPWGLCKAMSQLLQDQLLDMGAKPLPTDLSQATPTVAAARAVAGWQSNKRVLPLVPEFKHVVNVRGSFTAASMHGLQVGCKLPAPWEVPASANVDPCFVSSVPQGAKVLRILTVPGDSSEDASDNLSAGQADGQDDSPAASFLHRTCSDLHSPPEDAHPAEKLACIMLRWNTRFSQEEMRTLLDMLPQKHQTRARGSCDDQSNQFLCGAYAHGPMTGCKNLTRDMPWCTAVLCKHVRDNAPGFCFSAVGYLCNVRAEAHRDLHNEPGTKNLIMATHACAGGGLWLEEAGGPIAMIVGKTQRAGRFHDLAVGRPFIFEPKRWHATQPWRGDRGVIVAYTPVGVTKLATADKGFLENLGFPLGPSCGSSDVPPRVAKVQKGSITFGVYHEPEEFVARALSVQHPCHLESLLPSELVEAIRANHSKDVATLGRERTEMLKKWLARAEELETAESQLKGSFSSHRRQVLCNKRLLLMKEMLDSVGHEDEDLISDLSKGFDLTGPLPRSNAFKNKYRPAAMAEETLRKSAGLVRGQVLASVKSSGDEIVDQGVLAATEKELTKGFIEGPVSASDIPDDGTVTHRFGVIQGETEEGPKVRPIDNYLSSLVNSVVSQSEQVPVHTLDVVAGMLAMWLHLSPLKSLRAGLVCKCWDLSAAYKQLPLSDKSFEKDSFFVIFCPRTRKHVIYKQRVMPFGAKASVTAFIRCAFGIWRLGVKMFALVWSLYFDDFLSACKPEERRHVEVVISTLFRLLGWDLSLDKLLPYDVCCKVLGIKIDMSEARLGLFKLANTEKRVLELTAALDEVLLAGRLSHSDCERLRGRLQFASGQLFGRRAKVALHQLSRHHGGRLSEVTSEACRFLRRLVSSNQSRSISRQLGNVVHVYVDASFSDEGKLCGIGGMAYDHKGSLLQWFGENLDASLVSQVMTSFERVKETVIFELEALAVYVALKFFFKALKGKNVVVFTDNEGVHGAFVKCWTVSQFATHVIDAVCAIEESLGFMIWYDRVPSVSNPSDPLSRGVWNLPTPVRVRPAAKFFESLLEESKSRPK